MKTHKSLSRCVPVSCILTPSSVTFGSWLLCCVSFLLSQFSCSCHFPENTQRARRCLCNHRRVHGTDDLSVQGQRLFCLRPLWFQLQTGETKLWIFSVLQRFYESGCCTEPTDTERTHVSRFHTRPAAGKSTSALPTRKHLRAPYNKVSESNTILHPIVIVFPTNLC